MLSGCSWLSVSALGSAPLPALRLLDLRWIEDVKDSQLRELLLPPPDTKPGVASTGEKPKAGDGGCCWISLGLHQIQCVACVCPWHNALEALGPLTMDFFLFLVGLGLHCR